METEHRHGEGFCRATSLLSPLHSLVVAALERKAVLAASTSRPLPGEPNVKTWGSLLVQFLLYQNRVAQKSAALLQTPNFKYGKGSFHKDGHNKKDPRSRPARRPAGAVSRRMGARVGSSRILQRAFHVLTGDEGAFSQRTKNCNNLDSG